MAIFLNAANSTTSHLFSVIFGLVPKILLQQVTNLVKKLALLLYKYRFIQDCRNRLCVMSGNDRCRVFGHSICCKFLKRMYHPGHSTNSLRSKPSVTGNCVGRSMIEMLGVLAIIAVLSVGGIAGYSKAMMLWKSNQQRNTITELLANAIKIKPSLDKETKSWDNLAPTIAAMGDMPEGLSLTEYGQFQTKDNIYIEVHYGFQPGVNYIRYSILFWYMHSGARFSPAVNTFCKNLILSAQTIAQDVELIAFWLNSADSSNGIQFYSHKTDLATTNISEITQKCNQTFTKDGQAIFELLLEPY